MSIKSCLLCLRNEGLFANDPTNEFDILLNLFSLPKEFSKTLEGNKCCSVCRVKLQFVHVINEEISILNQKLKLFGKEVKEQFVGSFSGGFVESEDELTKRTRINLLNQLKTFPHFGQDESSHSAIKIEFNFSDVEDEEFGKEISDPLEDSQDIQNSEDTDFEVDETTNCEEVYELPSSSRNIKSAKFPPRYKSSRKRKIVKSNRIRKMRIYVCTLCEEREEFEQTDEYEKHLIKFHPERPYSTCPICTRIILEEIGGKDKRLKCHMKIHEDKRPFSCHHCDARFKLKTSLGVHLKTHLVCEICNGKFTGLLAFNFHLKEHNENYFNCVYCGIASRTKSSLGYDHHLTKCKRKFIIRRRHLRGTVAS